MQLHKALTLVILSTILCYHYTEAASSDKSLSQRKSGHVSNARKQEVAQMLNSFVDGTVVAADLIGGTLEASKGWIPMLSGYVYEMWQLVEYYAVRAEAVSPPWLRGVIKLLFPAALKAYNKT